MIQRIFNRIRSVILFRKAITGEFDISITMPFSQPAAFTAARHKFAFKTSPFI